MNIDWRLEHERYVGYAGNRKIGSIRKSDGEWHYAGWRIAVVKGRVRHLVDGVATLAEAKTMAATLATL